MRAVYIEAKDAEAVYDAFDGGLSQFVAGEEFHSDAEIEAVEQTALDSIKRLITKGSGSVFRSG